MAIPFYVLNSPAFVVPLNLRYLDANEILVTELYPREYITIIGQNVNTIINNFTDLSALVTTQQAEIIELQLLTSGITAPYETPEISPSCLVNNCSGCTSQPIDQVLTLMVSAWCTFVNVIGSNSQLLTAVSTQCPNLNSEVAFSGGQMNGLQGWISNPTTVADSLINMWLTICDARAGIQTLFDAVTPTCAQVIVNFAANVVSYTEGINLYFSGYSFIPTGFVDNGSIVRVVDTAGNIYQTSIDVPDQSLLQAPFNIPITGTTLLPNSNYTVYLVSNLTNPATDLTCEKTTIVTAINNITVCPTITTFPSTQSITFTLLPFITSDVTYRVDLYSASGMTSIDNTSFVNPGGIQAYTFLNLTTGTDYYIRATVTVDSTAPVTCSLILVTTL